MRLVLSGEIETLGAHEAFVRWVELLIIASLVCVCVQLEDGVNDS